MSVPRRHRHTVIGCDRTRGPGFCLQHRERQRRECDGGNAYVGIEVSSASTRDLKMLTSEVKSI